MVGVDVAEAAARAAVTALSDVGDLKQQGIKCLFNVSIMSFNSLTLIVEVYALEKENTCGCLCYYLLCFKFPFYDIKIWFGHQSENSIKNVLVPISSM